MRNNYTVYVHINKENNKRYFGITQQNPKRRWQNGTAYKKNKHFTSAIEQYGWDNFEHLILYTNLNEKKAKEKEIELIEYYKTTNRLYGYNKTNGGEGAKGHKHTLETKNKMSEFRKGKKFKPHSEETKKKMSDAAQNMSEEHKKKLSDAAKNKVLSNVTKIKLSQAHKGKILTEEHKLKMSESHKGINIGKDNGMSQKVICLNNYKIFDCISEAAKFYNSYVSNISGCCMGKTHNKTAGKHPETGEPLRWMYYEDYIEQQNITN